MGQPQPKSSPQSTASQPKQTPVKVAAKTLVKTNVPQVRVNHQNWGKPGGSFFGNFNL